MTVLTQMTDEKGRINLPKNFANSTVLVEQVSETELRIRKARVIAEDELPFVEETIAPLSDRDRDLFLALLDSPPPPNDALRRLLTSDHPQDVAGDRGGDRSSQSIDLTVLSWPDFFARVKEEKHPPDQYPLMLERLLVIRKIRQLFADHLHFRDLDYLDRRKIAGLLESTNPNFLLFGSMRPKGYFKQAILHNNEGISLALDEIPLQGDLSRDHFLQFAAHFLKSFKGSGMALASRLLAMKRPDTFVCVNNQNRAGLCQAFGIGPSRDAEGYWDLIERIRACAWWKAPPPAAEDERDIWSARAAFLDALFYTGVGM